MQALGPTPVRDPLETRPHRFVTAWPWEEAARERPVVKPRAANEDRLLAARRDVSNGIGGVARVVRGGVLLRWIRDVHHVMTDPLLFADWDLVGADVEHAVDRGRIAGDDLAVEMPGQRDTERTLAGGGRTNDRDESWALHRQRAR